MTKHLDSIIITFILFILTSFCLYFLLPKEVMLAGQTILYSLMVISIGLTAMFSLMVIRASATQMEGIVMSGLNVAERYYQVKANSWDTDTKRKVIEVNGNVWERESLQLLPTPQIIRQLPQPESLTLTVNNPPMYGNDWIDRFLFTPNRELKTYHESLNGATRSGKTTLAIEMIHRIGLDDLSNLYIIDPKPTRPDKWPKEPFCDDIDKSLDALTWFQNKMKKERLASKDNPIKVDYDNLPHVFLIIDEWDWIYKEFKNEAVSIATKIFKVLGELRVHVFLMGQSPLASDTGLSGSDFKNFGRVIINDEVFSFLKNPQFPYDKETKQALYQQAIALKGNEERVALVIPQGAGMPSVEKVPHLEPRKFDGATKVDEMEWVVTKSETQSEASNIMDMLLAVQDKFNYHPNGKVTVNSICKALGISNGGGDWNKADTIYAPLWDAYKEKQNG